MSFICLETSYSSSRSSSLDQQYDLISFEMADGHQSLCSGNVHSATRSQSIPFYRCQSLWIGSSSRTDETILSWSLDGRPIPVPYQHSGNNGHSFCTEESHTIHIPLLCHDFKRQYNSGVLYQQTRGNTFLRPMHGGIGNSPLVPGTYYTQNLSYSRQIQHISRPSLEIGQISKDRMVFGSIGGKFHFSNAQFFQYGFVCDSIQSQTPIVCISSSEQSSLSDRRIINELHAYAFPPTILIPSILAKICQSRCIIVLIGPLWPQQLWILEVLQLLVSALIHLLLLPKLLIHAKGKFQHQNLPFLAIHAWELSSNQLEIKSFRKTLQILSQNQDEHLLRKSMMQNGLYIPIDVIERRLIRSQPLLQL